MYSSLSLNRTDFKTHKFSKASKILNFFLVDFDFIQKKIKCFVSKNFKFKNYDRGNYDYLEPKNDHLESSSYYAEVTVFVTIVT